MRYDLIELCAGTAAVSLAAVGGSKFPVSRIGSKSGFVEPVHRALSLRPPISSALVVESDPSLAALLMALLSPHVRAWMADAIDRLIDDDPREVWERARRGTTPVDTLLHIAGARGGIGGFKGAHKLRPNVDGFIPSRASLALRVRDFDAQGIDALCCDVSSLDPVSFEPAAVYIDPPYEGRQGYSQALSEPVTSIAARWAAAGHRVVVSEGRPLPGSRETVNIASERKGQKRRSLTVSDDEWLSVYYR